MGLMLSSIISPNLYHSFEDPNSQERESVWSIPGHMPTSPTKTFPNEGAFSSRRRKEEAGWVKILNISPLIRTLSRRVIPPDVAASQSLSGGKLSL
jgi:hypothetical protein